MLSFTSRYPGRCGRGETDKILRETLIDLVEGRSRAYGYDGMRDDGEETLQPWGFLKYR